MGMHFNGVVVETERKPWAMPNGSSGVSFNLWVNGGSIRDGAQKIKVKPEQFGQYQTGDKVDLPVNFFARASDFGGEPRKELVLDPEYVYERKADTATSARPLATAARPA